MCFDIDESKFGNYDLLSSWHPKWMESEIILLNFPKFHSLMQSFLPVLDDTFAFFSGSGTDFQTWVLKLRIRRMEEHFLFLALKWIAATWYIHMQILQPFIACSRLIYKLCQFLKLKSVFSCTCFFCLLTQMIHICYMSYSQRNMAKPGKLTGK